MPSNSYHQRIAGLEASYWWFRALQAVWVDLGRRMKLNGTSRILDAGCGTGKTLEVLADRLGVQAYGFDLGASAAQVWSSGRRRNVCRGSIDAIPFRDGFFDAVFSVDVLGYDEIREPLAIQELLRVLRPGGILMIQVPAFQWLESDEHRASGRGERRYTRAQLATLLNGSSVKPIRLSYLFMSTLAPIAFYRGLRRLVGLPLRFCLGMSRRQAGLPSELSPLPPVLNELLFRLVDWERHLVARVNLPFGSSLLAIARKVEP